MLKANPKNAHTSAEQINNKLEIYYRKVVRSFLESSAVPNGYVGPFLISCPTGFVHLSCSWMYVGQETCDWGKAAREDDVDILIKQYQAFNLAEDYWNSPFWSFGHTLDRQLNPRGPGRSFVWSNIAR